MPKDFGRDGMSCMELSLSIHSNEVRTYGLFRGSCREGNVVGRTERVVSWNSGRRTFGLYFVVLYVKIISMRNAMIQVDNAF